MKKVVFGLLAMIWAAALSAAPSGKTEDLRVVIQAQKVVLSVLERIDDVDDAKKYGGALRDAIDKLGEAKLQLAASLSGKPDADLPAGAIKEFTELTVNIQAHIYRLERDQTIAATLQE